MISVSLSVRSACMAVLRDSIDAGTGTAKLRLYAGTRPSPGDTPSGSVLVEIDLATPCGTVAGHELTLTMPAWTVVAASGVLSWGRISSRSGDWIVDMDVGLLGSGKPIEVNTLTVTAGGLLSIQSAILSM